MKKCFIARGIDVLEKPIKIHKEEVQGMLLTIYWLTYAIKIACYRKLKQVNPPSKLSLTSRSNCCSQRLIVLELRWELV